MTTNDIRARSGQLHQRITVAGVDYMTQWPSGGARDRFLLAVAATDQFRTGSDASSGGLRSPRPRPTRVTPQNRGIHVTTRHHWS